MIVTIDGPAGTGKSTVARRLAQSLGFEFLDTGAMYRAVALACVRGDVSLTEERAVADLVGGLLIEQHAGNTFLNGENVSLLLRTPAVTEAASIVAQIPDVRTALVVQQQAIARRADTVSEGRDQGTVVFPQAECKFFLTASPEIRARRRWDELRERGQPADFDELLRQQAERDYRDQHRQVAPLVPAADALLIDTSDLSTEEVLVKLVDEVQRCRSVGERDFM